MQVKAIKQGFFGVARKYPGDVFEMPHVTVKAGEVIGKNGKPVSWVTPANGEGLSSPKVRGASETGKLSQSDGSGENAGQ